MLKVILGILVIVIVYIVGFCMGCSWIFKRNFELVKKQCERGDRFSRMFRALNQWLTLKEESREIAEYFRNMNYHNIAIYGMGYLGKHLVRELKKTEIKINYTVDKKVNEPVEGIKIFRPKEVLPEVDVIVVTALIDFEEIADQLERKVECPIISLEDILFEI